MVMAPFLLSRFRRVYVIADKGYDADHLRDQLRRQRCRVVIPSNRTRKRRRPFNRKLYKSRHHVENYFQRIKRYRRVAMRFEKLAANFFAMICLASVLVWLL
jgi:transposase